MALLEQSWPILSQLAHLGALFRPFWASLGLSWTISGPSWGHPWTKSFLETPVLISLCPGLVVLGHFGVGPKIMLFWGNLWGHFLDQFLGIFCTTFGAILGSHFGPDRPRSGQDGPQRAIKIFKVPLHLQKPLKTCGSGSTVHGCPRQPGKAQESSQEAFEEL